MTEVKGSNATRAAILDAAKKIFAAKGFGAATVRDICTEAGANIALVFKLVLEKAEEPEIKLPTSAGLLKKQESSRKNIYFCYIDYAKAFDCAELRPARRHSRLPHSRSLLLPGRER